MTGHVVTVPPAAIVKTAVILMKGHEIGALPVVHNHEALVGIVYYQNLLGEDQQMPVSDVMTKTFYTISPGETVFDAAEILRKNDQSHLLVVDQGELVGIISHSDALKELGSSFDPLTGLPWSDALRDWATTALKRGNDIAVILVDLNQFGIFNKKYGHVVGDVVLKSVAESLKATVDSESDFLSRYGGDEFAVASIRSADEAIELGERFIERISQIEIAEVPEGVSATFGLFGGRRTKERLDVHYAATLDDLINHASQNCTLNKPNKLENNPAPLLEVSAQNTSSPDPLVSGGRLKIDRISLSSSDAEATVEVSLLRGNQKLVHTATGYAVATKGVVRLVAEAAAAAVSSSLAPGYGVIVDDVMIQSTSPDNDIVTVVAAFITPSNSTMHVGSAIVRRADPHRAAASALLATVNRRLQVMPTAPPPVKEEIAPEA